MKKGPCKNGEARRQANSDEAAEQAEQQQHPTAATQAPASILPVARPGRRNAEQQATHDAEVERFCQKIVEIDSRSDFKVSARGWCYVLEAYGVDKRDFDKAEKLINDCRKSGQLPLNICAEDGARLPDGLEQLDRPDPKAEIASWFDAMRSAHKSYKPLSRWVEQRYYVEIAVEKIDLKSLFVPVCEKYGVPITNFRGWTDLNSRAAMMRRFRAHERAGRTSVLLYCGDHDPGGLHISGQLKENFRDLAGAVIWNPDKLIVDRFGLNADFIEKYNLTWIDGLTTGNAKGCNRLDDPKSRRPRESICAGVFARVRPAQVRSQRTRSESRSRPEIV